MKAHNFKSDCVEFRNSYILLINFKLRLINFVYFFRHLVEGYTAPTFNIHLKVEQ